LWPREEPLGQVIRQPQPGDRRTVYRAAMVVGIARDVVYDIGSRADAALVYFPTSPKARNGSALLVRMRGDSAAARRIIEAAVEQVAPSAADMIIPMDKALDLRFFLYRLVSRITGFLGGLALLLTVSGIYGILSYLVSQRKREFGIRMAMGAEAGGIAAMVLRQSLRLAAAGAVIGATLALGLAKLLAHAMQPITVFDPVAYAGGLLVVIAAALAAAWVPARRAVRVNPAVTLRCD
jgi:predicted lysophospholipase L1 biosynthesis ABC-type transport system permease subunit